MIYGNKIKELRLLNELTQKSIAEVLKISRRTYGNYETEAKFIPLKKLNILCNFYNVSFDYVFGFTNKTNYKNIKEDIDLKFVSFRLKNFCKEKDIKQEALALTINLSQATISQYLNGKSFMSLISIYTICKEYNISADYLLGKIDSPKYLV